MRVLAAGGVMKPGEGTLGGLKEKTVSCSECRRQLVQRSCQAAVLHR